MPADTLFCRDIYLKHTDKEGNVAVRCHRVWNGDLLIATLLGAAVKEGGKAFVQQLTEEQYRKERAK